MPRSLDAVLAHEREDPSLYNCIYALKTAYTVIKDKGILRTNTFTLPLDIHYTVALINFFKIVMLSDYRKVAYDRNSKDVVRRKRHIISYHSINIHFSDIGTV